MLGYMAAEVGIAQSALPLIVGMVSIGNGLGRLAFGALADKIGGKKAMSISNLVFIFGLTMAVFANKTGLHIFIGVGFVFAGIGYGAPSTLSAALVKRNFGEKYYPQNLSAVILALIPASLIGPMISAGIYQQFGEYLPAYLIMIGIILGAFLPIKIYGDGQVQK